jgi:thiamine kinase-like enzyme
MAQHRSVPCPATAVAVPLAGIITGLAVGAVNAHMSGIAAARAAREEHASSVLAQQLSDAVNAAHEWSDYAKRLIAENEKLKAENSRLREVAAQRRGIIERMRAA